MTQLTDAELAALFTDPEPTPDAWESPHVRANRAEKALEAILSCPNTEPHVLILRAIAARGLGLNGAADQLLDDAEKAIARIMDGDP